MYHLFKGHRYIIRFPSSSCGLEFWSLEVKYNQFRNRDEGTWQKPLIILTTRSLVRTSHVCHRRRTARRNQQMEEYKHTHTCYYYFKCMMKHSTKKQASKIFEKSKKKHQFMGIYSEHIGLLETLNLFVEKRGSENSMVKNVVKKMKSSNFF